MSASGAGAREAHCVGTVMSIPARVSLVVSTLGRTDSLDALFASLQMQTHRDFEVIVVDQNDDDRVYPVVERYRDRMRIAHIRSSRGLSRGRNAGMKAASGTILAFPDDDCRYRPQTLARVIEFFDQHPAADGITGRAFAARGERPSARFAKQAHWLSRRSVWVGGISSVIFLRARVCAENGPFDEMLGLGAASSWTAAEETDYLARAVRRGARIHYDPRLVVENPGPRGTLTSAYVARGAAYGRAFGYVLRRHTAPLDVVCALLMRACGGALWALCRGRRDLFRYHCAVARGRWRGWREGRPTGATPHPRAVAPDASRAQSLR